MLNGMDCIKYYEKIHLALKSLKVNYLQFLLKLQIKNQKENCLFVETIYSLFFYLLIKSKKNTNFFIEENFFKLNKRIVDKLENYKLIRVEEKKEFKNKRLNQIYLIYYFYKIKMLIKKLKLSKYDEIFGLDHTLLGNFFIRKKFNLLEDGTANYVLNKVTLKQKIWNKIYGKNIEMGRDKKIKKIYLTGIAPIPEEIKHKVELINLKKLWNKKTKEEQKEILDIFEFNFEIVEILKKRKNILFTQPLYEDGTLTEEEKIEIYRKILKNYDEKNVVIKIHPREVTDYKKVFPNVVVLEQKFPSELLNVLDIKFEKAITIFSTAACTLDKDIEVDFYGTEVHPKIFEKFGCHNHIHKTNCFVK